MLTLLTTLATLNLLKWAFALLTLIALAIPILARLRRARLTKQPELFGDKTDQLLQAAEPVLVLAYCITFVLLPMMTSVALWGWP